MLCRTLAEIEAAAFAEGAGDPPLTQEQVNLVAAILAPYGFRPGPVDDRALGAGEGVHAALNARPLGHQNPC